MASIKHLGGALALLLAGTASANLIQNGSFEQGAYDDSLHPGYMRLDPGATDLTGWTIGGPGVDWHIGDPPTAHFGPAADGSYALDLSLDSATHGTASQDFATTPGASYRLTFALGSPFFDASVDVSVGNQNQTFTSPASALQYGFPWATKALTFTALSNTTTLTFTGGDGGFWAPVIDNVVIEAVPEAGSWAMLAAGLGVLAAAGRRARRRP